MLGRIIVFDLLFPVTSNRLGDWTPGLGATFLITNAGEGLVSFLLSLS